MRKHHHHQLMLSLATLNCFIIFRALLLNGQLAAGPIDSCNASSRPTCTVFKNITSTFPFLTSQACGSASSFFISECSELSSDTEKPARWPNFLHATTGTLGSPFVMGFSNPFLMSFDANISMNASLSNEENDTNIVTQAGVINLTWSETLINQSPCQSLAPLNQTISEYLPQSISLISFAHSAFQLTPSNIILLFNCKSSSPVSHKLIENSAACTSYEKVCNLQNSNCSQYIPASQELNLSQVTEGLDCKSAMFFVTHRLDLAWQWRPGLIQLNWSTNNNLWMNSILNSCEGCLQTNGSCGYKSDDIFQCYCYNNTVSPTNCTAADNGGKPKGYKANILKKIGFGAVGFAIALFLSLSLFCICKRKVFMKTSVPCSSPHINKSWVKKPSFLSRKQDPILAKEMSYEEIVHATESFAERHLLGDGGFGAVYRGVLADGCKVAVKRLYHGNYRRMEHFYNEIKVLSNLNHPNLVKLYGFCCEDDKELLLVFEYAPQGTVLDHLHNVSKPPMSWNLRLDIAYETADALSYLHNSVIPPIYHRDVKTTNILLDEGFHAKLADFGLSKFVPLKATHVSTAPQGTPGYLDPDYHQCYQLTDKSDVYSLGVVLMELISAKPAVDMSRERGEINLSALAVMKIKCGQLEDLVDPTLEMKKNLCVERSINRVVELAFQCLHAERDERPSMSFVAETLAKIRREHAQNEDGDGEDLPNTHTSTQSVPTTCQSCVSNGPKKPFQHPQDSPCSVVFSSGSSNPSSLRSSS